MIEIDIISNKETKTKYHVVKGSYKLRSFAVTHLNSNLNCVCIGCYDDIISINGVEKPERTITTIWLSGIYHRDDGPAIEHNYDWTDYWRDDDEWWVNGIRLSPEKENILNAWYNSKNK